MLHYVCTCKCYPIVLLSWISMASIPCDFRGQMQTDGWMRLKEIKDRQRTSRDEVRAHPRASGTHTHAP